MAAHGGVFTLNQADQQGISGYNSGNPDLKAEKGRSTTVGLVVTPRGIPMLRKFTFTADYFSSRSPMPSSPLTASMHSTSATTTTTRCSAASSCAALHRWATQCRLHPVQQSERTNSGGLGTEGWMSAPRGPTNWAQATSARD
jgi:hypothetical protein